MLSTKRFSDRVENYVKYRPGYPQQAIHFILNNGIGNNSVVCDVGSGTGIFSRLLVEHVHELIAVEPNDEMREYAEKDLGGFSNFKSVSATAENTTLENQSVDAIVAAQAFHWFNHEKCKTEFNRILKPGGIVVLIWNNRFSNTEFLKEYDNLLIEFGTDYSKVNHQNLTENDFHKFFNGHFEKQTFPNHQDFDLQGFLGRVFSSSYTPQKDHSNYNLFHTKLETLHKKYNNNGIVQFNYQTEVYIGKLNV